MVMDYVRHCYESEMWFWDDPPVRVRVRWFKADGSAEVCPHPHAYWSRKTYDREHENSGPGEELNSWSHFDKGENPLGYRGVRFCGSPEAFQDGGKYSRDKQILCDEDGFNTCCGRKRKQAPGAATGGGARFLARNVARKRAALVAGGGAVFGPPNIVYLPKAKEAGARAYYPNLVYAELPKAKTLYANVRNVYAVAAGLPKAKQVGALVSYGAASAAQLPKAKQAGAVAKNVLLVAAGLLKAKQGAATTRDVLATVAALPKAKQGSATGRDILRVSAGLPKAKQLIATVEDMPTLNSVFGCRLSAQSGTSCPTADFAGVTRIYLEPHTSNQVALYAAGAWSILPVAGVFLDLAVTAGKVYDVFAYNNGGAVALELGPAWTNDALRSAFLARQDGVWVRQSDPTRRWVGTLRASIANGTEDSARQRWLWNAHNQEPRALRWAGQASNATYSVQAWRQVAASAANYVSVVRGNDERPVVLTALMLASNTLDYPSYTGVGVDSSTVNSAAIRAGSGQRSAGDVCVAEYVGYPGAGYHELRWLEFGAATGVSVDFYAGAVEGQGGLQGFCWA